MTKIEEVAKAIYEGRNGRGCKPWSRLPRSHQEPYLSDAKNALKAMKEPAVEMLKAMLANIGPLKEMWRAAIDTALSEASR